MPRELIHDNGELRFIKCTRNMLYEQSQRFLVIFRGHRRPLVVPGPQAALVIRSTISCRCFSPPQRASSRKMSKMEEDEKKRCCATANRGYRICLLREN